MKATVNEKCGGMYAKAIIRTLARSRWRRNFCLPHYTPALWWECDLFELTKASYFREYEVKVTRGDFFADAKKWSIISGLWPEQVAETKHARLAAAVVWGPSFFWYVTPEGLLQPNELPSWAGLIEMIPRRGSSATGWHPWNERETVRAPRLHRGKCDEKVMAHARGVCYYRMHELMGVKK